MSAHAVIPTAIAAMTSIFFMLVSSSEKPAHGYPSLILLVDSRRSTDHGSPEQWPILERSVPVLAVAVLEISCAVLGTDFLGRVFSARPLFGPHPVAA